jgi:hypothetical protein
VNPVKKWEKPDDLVGMAISMRRPCQCGHERDQHEHYRRGADCSGCACAAFHGQLVVTIRFGRQLTPAGSVVVPDDVPAAQEPYVRPTHSAGLTAGCVDGVAPLVVEPRAAADESRLRQHSSG